MEENTKGLPFGSPFGLASLAPVVLLNGSATAAKFSCRKRHITEQATRIARLAASALLIRNTIIRGCDKILRGAFNAEYREKPKRNVQAATVIIGKPIKTALLANARRNLIAGAAGIASAVAVVSFQNGRSENDGLNRFYNRDRQIGRATCRHASVTGCVLRITAEDTHIALAAVKHDLFIQHGNTVKFLCTAVARTGLQVNLYVKARRDLIKPAVKLDRVDRDICPKNFGAHHANGRANAIQNVSTRIIQIDARVFVAILITTRIEYTVGVDTNGISSAGGGAPRITGASVL